MVVKKGVMGALLLSMVNVAWGLDEESASSLARKSGCMKCHGIDKKKDGPAFTEIARKYKGKADAEKKLITQVTTNPKVKIDGNEEEHESLKSKDQAAVLNVVQWIMTR